MRKNVRSGNDMMKIIYRLLNHTRYCIYCDVSKWINKKRLICINNIQSAMHQKCGMYKVMWKNLIIQHKNQTFNSEMHKVIGQSNTIKHKIKLFRPQAPCTQTIQSALYPPLVKTHRNSAHPVMTYLQAVCFNRLWHQFINTALLGLRYG